MFFSWLKIISYTGDEQSVRIRMSIGFLPNDVWTFVSEENEDMILATVQVFWNLKPIRQLLFSHIIHNYGKILTEKIMVVFFYRSYQYINKTLAWFLFQITKMDSTL